jgi:glycosyltransferase involved in cell wall biosynthesis
MADTRDGRPSAGTAREATPPEIVFAIPGDLSAPTGGYGYARRLMDELPSHGVPVRYRALPGAYPQPSEADLAATAATLAAASPKAVLLIDGLAFGAMPEGLIAGLERRIVALVHHPLGLENGLPPTRQQALIRSETRALALARHVIVTSPLTGRLLQADFAVPAEKITVAEPGTDPAARSRGTGRPVQVLSVGTVSPRKGYDLLVEALRPLAALDWRATIAGATDRDPGATEALIGAVAAAGLADRIALVGAVDRDGVEALYATADLLVSPSLFEGYGMVLAEALARGLPLVASTGGAAAETVPDAAALKVAPGDIAGLTEALRRMIEGPDLRRRLADAAWIAGQALPRWSGTAARIAAVLRRVAS